VRSFGPTIVQRFRQNQPVYAAPRDAHTRTIHARVLAGEISANAGMIEARFRKAAGSGTPAKPAARNAGRETLRFALSADEYKCH
jgi:hypothetical protein